MVDLHGLAAVGDLVSAPWRSVLTAATTICGVLLVAATFPKGALSWIRARARRLVTASQDSLPAAPEDQIAAAPDRETMATPGLGQAPEPEPEPLPEPALPEPAATGAADPASNRADVHTADGEQILGRYCRMDTASTAEGLEFTIEVPGLKETDLEIRMVGDTIVVTGQVDLDRTDKTYRVVEREVGAFSRFIKVSEGVPLHRIQAWLDRGLLTVFVPNPTVQVGAVIAVNAAVRRVFEGDDLCELKIDLPGVDDRDVDLSVRDGVLTISCRDGAQAAGADDQTADALAPRLLQSMALPAGVDANQIRAVLAKGVLTVTLPIAAGHRQRTIPLDSVREAAGPETRSSDAGARPCPPAGGSGAPFHGPGDPPFDFWSASEILAGRSLHRGKSIDRRF